MELSTWQVSSVLSLLQDVSDNFFADFHKYFSWKKEYLKGCHVYSLGRILLPATHLCHSNGIALHSYN